MLKANRQDLFSLLINYWPGHTEGLARDGCKSTNVSFTSTKNMLMILGKLLDNAKLDADNLIEYPCFRAEKKDPNSISRLNVYS